MVTCLICGKTMDEPKGNPYHRCPACGFWRQDPIPTKRFEGPDKNLEPSGDTMIERDKGVNRDVAARLLRLPLPSIPNPRFLDIGAKYPFLMRAVRDANPRADVLAIDGIDDVVRFGAELDVPVAQLDIETLPTFDKTFDVISLIHVIEHMADPVAVLRHLGNQLTRRGYVFIRCPLNDVSGFEQDLTDHHYTIHPSFFSSQAIHRLADLAGLNVISYAPMNGAGQGDFIIARKSMFAEKIGVGMIVKNEERDLPRALNSISRFADRIAIVDTGSTDGTERVVKEFCETTGRTLGRELTYRTYTDASSLEDGDLKLYDFSKARNQYVEELERDCDWILWMDADDEMASKANLRALAALPADAFEFGIVDNFEKPGTRFNHMRFWRVGFNVRYEGACHEYPTASPEMRRENSRIDIRHHWDEKPAGEPSTSRNLRILQREYEGGNRKSRTLFYLANSFRDCQRWSEAEKIYNEYLTLNEGWHDEKVYAYVYLSRCRRAKGDHKGALSASFSGISIDSRFSELWMEAAYSFYEMDNQKTIACCISAIDKLADTTLFLEHNKYTDQPWRLMAAWYERKGMIPASIAATNHILALVPNDADMKAQLERLKKIETTGEEIHLLRPGAAGDLLCVLQCLPALRAAKPSSRVILHCHPSFHKFVATSPFVYATDSHESCPAGTIILIGYPLADGYPHVPMKDHLINGFAKELGVTPDGHAHALALPKNPLAGRRYATIHTQAGWSPYKEWQHNKWQALIERMKEAGVDVVQIGGSRDPHFDHVSRNCAWPLDVSLAILKGATFHVGIDSWTNHATAFLPITPSVILWGSTSPTGSGYAHNKNLYRSLPCQPCYREYPEMSRDPKPPCPDHPEWTNAAHPCMASITVDDVWSSVSELIDRHWK